MSLSHCFQVKSVQAGIFLVQTISTTLSPLCDADNKLFCGSHSYFQRHFPGCITDRKKSLYLHNRAPPSSNVDKLRMSPWPREGMQQQTLLCCGACARGWCATIVSSRQGKSVSNEAGSRSLCGCWDFVSSNDQLRLEK